ncbi:MAG: Ig-like domain-containing protein [Planctomycetes bacterium]|nr:Ig-like domain-containing protein [Planctomycetota bacterium]
MRFRRLRAGTALIVLLASAGLAFAGVHASFMQEAPRVVKMTPENGATDVDPNLEEIVVVFSEPMTDGSWSVTGGGENFPEIKSIRYTNKCTELIIKVGLKPDWTYNFGLNSPSHRNFKSQKGVPLEPMRVTFSTRGKGGAKKSSKTAVLGKIDFNLEDAHGLRLCSRDYKGVPLFITFGAAW